MAEIKSIADLVEHFCRASPWPPVFIKSSALMHGNILYSLYEDKYIPAAIKVSEELFIVNVGCGMKTRGTVEQHVAYVEDFVKDNVEFADVYGIEMGPVEYPGDYPDLETGLLTLETIKTKIEWRQHGKLILLNGKDQAYQDSDTVMDVAADERKLDAIKSYRKDRGKREEYERFKELMGVDQILKEAIEDGGIDEEKYERIKQTYEELKQTVKEAEDYIKKATQI